MFETAVDPRAITQLRGRFKRSVGEWLFPVCLLGALQALPIWVYLSPAPSVDPPLVILALVYGFAPTLALVGVYWLTTSFEFDGKFVTCRRLGSVVAWRHAVAGIEAVEVGSPFLAATAGTLNYYYVRWSDARRAVYLTADMRAQLKTHFAIL